MKPFYKILDEGLLLYVKITPKSSKNTIKSLETLKEDQVYLSIAIRAIPEKGKANKELLKFLSKILKLSQNTLFIKQGENARFKQIMITTKDNFQIIAQLKELLS